MSDGFVSEGLVSVQPSALAVGGDAIARGPDGKVVFVTGGLPGEELDVRIIEQKADFARAIVATVRVASPDRVEPSCPHVLDGCGGCGWQHVSVAAQPHHKRAIVIDALKRTGRVEGADELVSEAPNLAVGGHRTTVRVMVVNGRAAYRAARSNRGVVVNSCEVAHPAVERVLLEGRFGRATEVTIRHGEATGEILVLADPTAGGVRIPDAHEGRITVVGLDEVKQGSPAAYHENVAGVTFRVSASSFFQTRLDGAELLVALVDEALGAARDVLVDLYGGVGLFAGTIGRRFRTVVSVEEHAAASDDAIVNLAHLDDSHVVQEDVDTWRPHARTLRGRDVAVIADPSRRGLGRDGVGTISTLAPSVLVLVSCDAASLGRDALLLREAGFALQSSIMVDLFPQTPHVEVVSRFVPASR